MHWFAFLQHYQVMLVPDFSVYSLFTCSLRAEHTSGYCWCCGLSAHHYWYLDHLRLVGVVLSLFKANDSIHWGLYYCFDVAISSTCHLSFTTTSVDGRDSRCHACIAGKDSLSTTEDHCCSNSRPSDCCFYNFQFHPDMDRVGQLLRGHALDLGQDGGCECLRSICQ